MTGDLFLTLRVSAALFDQVDRATQRAGVSRSAWVRQALDAAFRDVHPVADPVDTEPPAAPPKLAHVESVATGGLCARPRFRRVTP